MTLLDADKIQRFNSFGEDTCELLRTIEASFEIEFSEDELISCSTIRKLGECIFKKLEYPISDRCLTAVLFYHLRRVFIDLYKAPRSVIGPETLLSTLMPWRARKRRWQEIQKYLGVVLPKLALPIWLFGLSVGIVVALVASTSTWVISKCGSVSYLLIPAGAIAAWVLVLRLLAPLARTFPRSCNTLGDLVRLVLARNYAVIASRYGGTSEKELLSALYQLIAAETSIDAEEINPEARFPEGLNIY